MAGARFYQPFWDFVANFEQNGAHPFANGYAPAAVNRRGGGANKNGRGNGPRARRLARRNQQETGTTIPINSDSSDEEQTPLVSASVDEEKRALFEMDPMPVTDSEKEMNATEGEQEKKKNAGRKGMSPQKIARLAEKAAASGNAEEFLQAKRPKMGPIRRARVLRKAAAIAAGKTDEKSAPAVPRKEAIAARRTARRSERQAVSSGSEKEQTATSIPRKEAVAARRAKRFARRNAPVAQLPVMTGAEGQMMGPRRRQGLGPRGRGQVGGRQGQLRGLGPVMAENTPEGNVHLLRSHRGQGVDGFQSETSLPGRGKAGRGRQGMGPRGNGCGPRGMGNRMNGRGNGVKGKGQRMYAAEGRRMQRDMGMLGDYPVVRPRGQLKGNKTLPRRNQQAVKRDFTPPVDVFDTPDAYVIHASLPGVKKDDVTVNWNSEKSKIFINGVVHRPAEVTEKMLASMPKKQRKFGKFEKKVKLGNKAQPARIYPHGISAKLEEGILKVEVPKEDRDSDESAYVEVNKSD